MAPEVFDKEKGHGKLVDLYAIGIIMYILCAPPYLFLIYHFSYFSYDSLCGYPPFEPENGITELEFPSPEWDEISEEAKQLIAVLPPPPFLFYQFSRIILVSMVIYYRDGSNSPFLS